MPPHPRRPSWPADVRFALPLLFLGLVGTRPAGQSQPDAARDIDHGAYALVVLAAAALLVRSRRPRLAVAVNTAAVSAYLVAGYAFGPILLTVPVLALALAEMWPRRTALVAEGLAVGVIFTTTAARTVAFDAGGTWGDLATAWFVWAPVIAAAFATGAAVRVRRESFAGVRAEQARRAASEEQLRLAQELHDVVGHGLAVIAMQAGVALHVLDRDKDKVRESLEAIRTMSRESLEGLRTELAQLRAGSGDSAKRRPLPGLADLEVLVARIRAGGVDVRLDVSGPFDDVPTEHGAAAYRIVQESLTNVLRHADTAAADVKVHAADAALSIEVTDHGRGSQTDGEGAGISGMRERTTALGGSFEAGARATGGFQVKALLPLPSPTPQHVP